MMESNAEQHSKMAQAGLDALKRTVRDVEHDRDNALAKVKALEAENESIKAQLFLLQNFGVAAKPAPVAAPEAWTDLPTYSYRRAGDVLLVAAENGSSWLTIAYGATNPINNGATRDEAKAILDAAVATKKAPEKARYAAKETLGGAGWCVMRDGLVYSTGTMTWNDAERFAAALNAAKGEP